MRVLRPPTLLLLLSGALVLTPSWAGEAANQRPRGSRYNSQRKRPDSAGPPDAEDAGREAPHPPPAALGGAGPDPQLGR
ncbi:hypothetical protein D623_10002539 [Myotis brandtii]|uniref:Uncharacterized protein n=1 Tax=Myotis brandtii TaxID=109478 RepID=S7NJX8_MYOBR|nr:hypothetical protein D623_10002539 [Myotis brandtii]